MAHYYLNLIDGHGFTPDREGEDFPDLDAARERAKEGVRSILSDEIKSAGLINLRGRDRCCRSTGVRRHDAALPRRSRTQAGRFAAGARRHVIEAAKVSPQEAAVPSAPSPAPPEPRL
ncbi:DUF6894 family protein [Sphingomonas sp. 7/4-4]|uniref:DUF6894 family protein n=1 Tax=Sphingomonas sp. 7/4-4 TaxID=3018446 RepID=UPI003FA7D358